MSVTDISGCEVIDPQDERYDAARAVWNGSIDHRPAAIVRPRTDAEVADALLRARDDGAGIAVRGGGHSMQGHSMSDGGVTIDLSAINRVQVDVRSLQGLRRPARAPRGVDPRSRTVTDSSTRAAPVAWSAMPDAVKGGLFVGVAVATGIVVGLFVPSLVGAERDGANRPRAQKPSRPTMPSVVGRPLDEAETQLRRRGIAYVADAPDIVEVVAPGILEVCDSEPAAGSGIRGSARLHVAVTGTCDI